MVCFGRELLKSREFILQHKLQVSQNFATVFCKLKQATFSFSNVNLFVKLSAKRI